MSSDLSLPTESPGPPPDSGRIRTLLVITSTAGGAGLHAYYVAKHLPRSVFDLTVAFGPGYPLDRRYAELGLPIRHLSMSRSLAPLASARTFVQLWRLMRAERFDLVCTACSIAGVLGRLAAWMTGVPRRVLFIHAFASHPHQPRPIRWAYGWVERALDPFTTHYYAVSEATRRFGVERRLFAPEKATVVYNGIPLDSAEFRIQNSEFGISEAVRAECEFPADAPLIVTAGRLETQKGLSYLLEAAALVQRELPAARFLIVGDGPLLQRLRAQAEQLGLAKVVRFTGWRDDVLRLIRAADVFCLASLWESFGLVLAEAMSLSKPVVATNVDGIPEVVANGDTGLLVPPRDPPALAAALLTVLRDAALAARLGQAGRQRVAAHFRLEPNIERLAHELARHVGDARHPKRGATAVERGVTARGAV